MSRRKSGSIAKRAVQTDPKYGSELVAHMINYFMRRGKKTTAQRIVYGAVAELDGKVEGKEVLEVLDVAVNNMKPRVEVKSRRVGGASYQVPVEIKPQRQLALALRWLTTYAHGRRGMGMPKAVAAELIDAYNNTGNVIKKRDDTHKMAQANRAFAHYAF